MFIRRVNIFLISLVVAFAPALALAIDPIVPPFTSGSAGDIAASLGVRGGGGFGASAAGLATAAAAIGVGVGSYCITSELIGNSCNNPNNPICSVLKSMGATNCTPNPDGSFNVPAVAVDPSAPPVSGNYNYYAEGQNGSIPCCNGNKAVPFSALVAAYVNYMQTEAFNPAHLTYTYDSARGTTEPYYVLTLKDSSPNPSKVSLGIASVMVGSSAPPQTKPSDPAEVGKHIAASPAAAAALGAAAAAAANAEAAGLSPADQASLAAAAATAAAAAAPTARSCSSGYTLDATSGVCSNDGLSKPNTCAKGQVPNATGACVPADPLDPTKPADPASPALPAFCAWASVVCDAITWSKSQFNVDSAANENTKPEIKNDDNDINYNIGSVFDQRRFSMPSNCPAPTNFTLNVGGTTASSSFDLSPLCEILAKARPALIGISYLSAAYILVGAVRQ